MDTHGGPGSAMHADADATGDGRRGHATTTWRVCRVWDGVAGDTGKGRAQLSIRLDIPGRCKLAGSHAKVRGQACTAWCQAGTL